MLLDYLIRVNRKWKLRIAGRFLWNYLYYYPDSAKWVRFIHELYLRHGFSHAPILLVRKKCYFKYLIRDLSFADRVRRIEDHYNVASKLFSNDFMKTILAMDETVLAKITGKSGKSYEFYFGQRPELSSEGELSVFLREFGAIENLATLTFTLSHIGTNTKITIGGLQGPRAKNAKASIVDATRDLHGLRPKSAVIFALYGILGCLKVADLEAVSLANNPSKRIGKTFFADNDSFWSEFAERNAISNNFILPMVLPEKAIGDVVVKKKKLWLERQDLKKLITSSADYNLAKAMGVFSH